MQQDRLAAVGTLAAGLAHELNNPLTYVTLHLKKLEELTKDRWSREEAETLALIEEGTARMKSVILRPALSHARQRRTAGARRPEADHHLHACPRPRRREAAVTHRGRPRRDGDVVAHPSRLGQVFLNVIINALEAVANREDGLVRVVLRENATSLEVSVTDNGAGIPDDVSKRVFDPFFTTRDRPRPVDQSRHRHRTRRQNRDRERGRPRHHRHRGAPEGRRLALTSRRDGRAFRVARGGIVADALQVVSEVRVEQELAGLQLAWSSVAAS